MPEWVRNHDKWEKAKAIAKAKGKKPNYALVTEIYKRIGGKIARANGNNKRGK